MVKTGTREQESSPTPTQNSLSLHVAGSGDTQLDRTKSWLVETMHNRVLPRFEKGGTQCHCQLSFVSININ